MKWRPVHKRTGLEYPVITDQERKANWSRPPYSRNFRFEPIEETPKPTEAKPAKETQPAAQAANGPDQPNG